MAERTAGGRPFTRLGHAWALRGRSRKQRKLGIIRTSGMGYVLLTLCLAKAAAQSQGGSVSPYYGSFSTAVPIAIPSFRGLEPSVQITYGSSGGNGWCGVGASLRATSVIERGLPGGGAPRYDEGDAFFLDGMELIPSDLLGGTHCARIQNYARIARDEVLDCWYVTGTQGNRATYEPVLTNPGGTYRWALRKTADPRGNEILYDYWADGTNDCYLGNISYNGCKIEFRWELRPDPILFADGATMRSTRYRLKTVDVKVGPDRARIYEVRYKRSEVSGRSLIEEVQQFGRDATIDGDGAVKGGMSLPPMRLGWEASATGRFSGRVDDHTGGAAYAGYDRFLVDVNGDSKDDVLYIGDDSFAVFLSEGYGNFGSRIGGTTQGRRFEGFTKTVGDVDADGNADILYIGESEVRVFLGTRRGTFGPCVPTALGVVQSEKTASVADVTGDNRVDVVYIGDSEISVLPATGDGRFGTLVNTPTECSDLQGAVRVRGDVNADGRADIAYVTDTDYTLLLAGEDGKFGKPIRAQLNGNFENHDPFLSDANGDGKADFAFLGKAGFTVLLGLGNGTFGSPITATTGENLEGHGRFMVDVNGDGWTDIVYVGDGGFSIFQGLGDGTFGARVSDTTGGAALAGFGRYVGDLDGDGKSDVAFIADSSFATFLSEGRASDVVVLVENGIGGKTDVEYEPSTTWENTYMPPGMILQTVAALTTSDGRGTASTVAYTYQGGLWSLAERRFLGFRRVASVIDAEGNYTETWYFQRVGSISKPEYTYTRDSQGRIYNYSAYRYEENDSPPYTSLLTEKWDYTLNLSDTGRRTLMQMAYDMHANVIASYEYGDFDLSGDERTTIRGYYPNHTAYIVGLPAYENAYAGIGSGGELMARSVTQYDHNTTFAASPTAGNVTAVGKWNNRTGEYLYTRFEYDRFGNQTCQVDPLGFEGRTEYDSVYHLFPVRERNAVNHEMSREWDFVLGEKLSDIDPNGSVMRFTYDTLGRQTSVVYPDGASEVFVYENTGDANEQRTRRVIGDGSPNGLWSEIYRDGLGRAYRTRSKGNIEQFTVYRGTSDQVAQQSIPYRGGEEPRWLSLEYDGLGRVRKAVNPDGSFTEFAHGIDSDGKPFEAGYNEVGGERLVWTDAYGQIVEVWEYAAGSYAVASYEYNALGKMTRSTDPMGNVTEVIWDSLGRKIEVRDPNSGTTSFEYDARGAVRKRVDARGSTTSFTYDPSGRILSKATSDGAVYRWSYDQHGCGASVGRLTRIDYPLGFIQYVWDRRGREIGTIREIGTERITTQRRYDIAGRLSELVYPDGEVLRHSYDDEGQLASVEGVVSGMTWNAAGQLVFMEYRNSTRTEFRYDDARRWLSSAEVEGPDGRVYDAQYEYDVHGRVRRVSSTTSLEFNGEYFYDEMDRLTSVTGAHPERLQYDLSGRILFKSGIGSYGYGDQRHPSAPTRVGGRRYTYDACGNQVGRDGEDRLWDSENRLVTVRGPGRKTEFRYDHNGIRIERRDEHGVTRFFSPLVETVNGELVKYYYAGPVLVCRRDGKGRIWYHSDHLGSPRALTDDFGNTGKRYDYRVQGGTEYEVGSRWAAVGFGSHAPEPSVKLLYMGARFYDEELGLFVSPDTMMPDPMRTQAHNRYVFAFNNPVSNRDPSGHVPVAVPIIMAIGTTVGTASPVIATMAWIGAGLSVAGYYMKDPVLSTVGGVMLGFATGCVAPGAGAGAGINWAGGVLGGSVAAATSPLSELDSDVKTAVGWAFTAVGSIGGGGAGGAAGRTFRGTVQGLMTRGVQRAEGMIFAEIAEALDLEIDELNALLTVGSFLGNAIVGSRFKGHLPQGDGRHFIAGFGERESGWLVSFPFDVIDTALTLQGLPAASGYHYATHLMTTHNRAQLSCVGHSLGSLEVNVIASYGLTPGGAYVECLPFGASGAPGVDVLIGSKDPFNMWRLGRLWSPFARIQPQKEWQRAHVDYPVVGGLRDGF